MRIETTDLNYWADLKYAQSNLPVYIRRLISAVIPLGKLEECRFPGGDASQTHGFDGVVLNHQNNPFVPMDLSVWEIGTQGRDIKGKANEDYDKRVMDVQRLEKEGTPLYNRSASEITFVFATPRVWAKKADWISEKMVDGFWKSVRVIDGVDIVGWLEDAPVVNLTLAADINRGSEEGLWTLEQAWVEWSQRSSPPVSEELVLAGREEEENLLRSQLLNSSGHIIVRSDSIHESLGFALASLRHTESDDDRENLLARTIVAKSYERAQSERWFPNHIILLKEMAEQLGGTMDSRGHQVVIPEGNDAISYSKDKVIALPRPNPRGFADALRKMGFEDEEAETAARECGRSVTVFQRLKHRANMGPPAWAQTNQVSDLLPAILAGQWDSRNENDREILCRLYSVADYAEVESRLGSYLVVDEPPLRRTGDMRALAAPVDAFQLLARRFTKAHLDLFRDAFQDVFGRIEPRVELQPEERLFYRADGDEAHSEWLRRGMAESVLLIAERGDGAQLDCVPSPTRYVEEVVAGIPVLSTDWRILASVRREYPRLMEAAPDPLLSSLEHMLKAFPNDVKRLFAEGGMFGGGGMHTGILWGLELLAWSPHYLERATLILANLAEIDPGGQMGNRPINSLREIFLWWHPGTNASVPERIAVLDSILKRHPEIGWETISKILPTGATSTAIGTTRPKWKDCGNPPTSSEQREVQIEYVARLVDKEMEHVGTDAVRWGDLLESLGCFTSEQRVKALKLLEGIAKSGIPEEARTELWEKLRDSISRNRAYATARWALPSSVVDRLQAIADGFLPEDPVARNKWLFDDHYPELRSGEWDFEREKEELAQLRRQAVKEVHDEGGIQGIVELAGTCKFPRLVGYSTTEVIQELDVLYEIVDAAVGTGETGHDLAAGLSGGAYQNHGKAWRSLFLEKAKLGRWPCNATAALLDCWPDVRDTWDAVEALGEEVSAEYWGHKMILFVKGNSEEVKYQIDKLIGANRAIQVLDRTALHLEDVPSEYITKVFDAALDQLGKAQSEDKAASVRIESHDVLEFLSHMRECEDIPKREVARREYLALPILTSLDAHGLTLHEFMVEDPNFFVEVICDVYLPHEDDTTEERNPTPEEKARAHAGYTLLQGMNCVPGSKEGGTIDEDVLERWIEAVRRGAEIEGRGEVADISIGHILAHAPQDPADEAWPHKTIRSVLERLDNKRICSGIMTERFNMRGTYMKDPYEGGGQEREFATQYRTWVDQTRSDWPRTAGLLETIAKRWDDEAHRADIDNEQRMQTE